MLANEHITQDEYDQAILEPIELVEDIPILEQQYEAAYFVEEVKQWFLDNEDFAATRDDRARLLFEGGLDIYTTIDLEQQRRAEAIVEEQLPQTRANGDPNPDASVVVLGTTPEDDGHVLVMVGGRGFWSGGEDAKFNLATGGRQAGSSMKPIALAAALQMGIPITAVYPAPSVKVFEERAICGTRWRVKGGSGGLSTLAEATKKSRNTVFAQLMIDITPEKFVEMAEALGIGEDRIQPVCAAVLGSENVNMLEMATAYSTFARSGSRVDPTFVTRVANQDGTLLYQHTAEPVNVLNRSIADQLTWALTRVVGPGGTGWRAPLDGRPAAGKTGTAQENGDATFIGFTPQRSAGVWVGFPDVPTPMRGLFNGGNVEGGTFPAVIWREIMNMMHEGLPAEEFPTPPPSSTTTSRAVVPASVAVPDLIGRAIDQVLLDEVSATSLGFNAVDVVTSEFAPGTIFNQAPAAGSLVPGGADITVEVAVAPPEPTFAQVPDVTGLSEAEARQVLGGEGFNVTEDYQTDPESASPVAGAVWAQSPGAGEQVELGSVITIKVNPAGAPPPGDDG
jgi:penicillin-binding protein 1A